MTSRQLANVLIRLSGLLGFLFCFPFFMSGVFKGAMEVNYHSNPVTDLPMLVRSLLGYAILFSLFFFSRTIANKCFKKEPGDLEDAAN